MLKSDSPSIPFWFQLLFCLFDWLTFCLGRCGCSKGKMKPLNVFALWRVAQRNLNCRLMIAVCMLDVVIVHRNSFCWPALISWAPSVMYSRSCYILLRLKTNKEMQPYFLVNAQNVVPVTVISTHHFLISLAEISLCCLFIYIFIWVRDYHCFKKVWGILNFEINPRGRIIWECGW